MSEPTDEQVEQWALMFEEMTQWGSPTKAIRAVAQAAREPVEQENARLRAENDVFRRMALHIHGETAGLSGGKLAALGMVASRALGGCYPWGENPDAGNLYAIMGDATPDQLAEINAAAMAIMLRPAPAGEEGAR